MEKKKCTFCRGGDYVDLEVHNVTDLHNSGLGVHAIGRTAWRAVACDQCGNVQLFRIERSEDQLRQTNW